MRIKMIVRYEIDGQEFTSKRAAYDHVENELAEILQSALRLHDGRHKNSIKAVESILENAPVRARLSALLNADFTLESEEEN